MPHDDLLTLARTITLEVGEIVRQRRLAHVEVAASKSSSIDIVTAVDFESEQFIRDALAAARPDDGFLGEEGGVQEGSSGLTWIVDPIDGTVNFFYGIPHYAVSIAVVEGDADPQTWTALAGAVLNPADGELFTASAGGGAFLGDRPLRVTEPVELSQALISTGFSYDTDARAAEGELLATLMPRVRDVRRQGAAALDLCFVAAGRYDGYYQSGLKPWDHAAGVLIAQEAGALVKGRGDAAAGFDLILAGHPQLVSQLEAVVSR